MNNAITTTVVSKHRPLIHYTWGNNCEAWVLVDQEELQIKQERMPADAEEELHYHKKAQQFFQVISGRAVFEVDDVIIIVHKGEGLLIEAGKRHRVMNKENEDLEFTVTSQPSTKNDRFNIV